MSEERRFCARQNGCEKTVGRKKELGKRRKTIQTIIAFFSLEWAKIHICNKDIRLGEKGIVRQLPHSLFLFVAERFGLLDLLQY